MRKLSFGLIICLIVVLLYAYKIYESEGTKHELNQEQFERCMEGRSIFDREAIKHCENDQ